MLEPAVSDQQEAPESVRITLAGHVQGVGFRPFVYRLASRHGIAGQVRNRLGEVDIIASGPAQVLRQFESDLVADGTLGGFAIAGEDKVWHWADAKIDGKEVPKDALLLDIRELDEFERGQCTIEQAFEQSYIGLGARAGNGSLV